jgi:hypothetical protein
MLARCLKICDKELSKQGRQEKTMPYIPQARRDEIAQEIVSLGLDWAPQNAGDLNFLVSTFIDNALNERGVRYAILNEMIGALECCKLELYRVMAAPYEDEKMDENGGVYGETENGETY